MMTPRRCPASMMTRVGAILCAQSVRLEEDYHADDEWRFVEEIAHNMHQSTAGQGGNGPNRHTHHILRNPALHEESEEDTVPYPFLARGRCTPPS